LKLILSGADGFFERRAITRKEQMNMAIHKTRQYGAPWEGLLVRYIHPRRQGATGGHGNQPPVTHDHGHGLIA
jgi:hypothetical protein